MATKKNSSRCKEKSRVNPVLQTPEQQVAINTLEWMCKETRGRKKLLLKC